MAFDPGPPPKRSDFVTAATYHLARSTWKTQKDAWRAEQRQQRQAERRAQNRNRTNGTVGGQPAVVQHGNTGRVNRVDALWGGQDQPDGMGHGHLVSNDGLNASYLRDPGMGDGEYVVDDRMDDPYG